MDKEFKFNSINDCKTQKDHETFYKERGWDIVSPTVINDGKCKHQWIKVGERDYQCKCGQGFIGVPDGI